MKLALIDNEDSFTYNLRQALLRASEAVTQLDVIPYSRLREIQVDDYDGFVISPGPGEPDEYLDYFRFLDQLPAGKNLLGVCLGMQIMSLWKGYRVYRKREVIHGMSATLRLLEASEYTRGMEDGTEVGLYHSWAVDSGSSSYFRHIALDADGHLMIIAREHMLGVQYHPESFLSSSGQLLLKNWVEKGT